MAGQRKPCTSPRQIRGRCEFCSIVLVALVLAVEPVHGSEPGRGPPSDTGPPATSRVSSHPRQSPVAENHSFVAAADPKPIDGWHQNLIRERHIEVRLRTALRDLEAGQLISGLTGLQSIIDRDDDVFVRIESASVPCGAHAVASRFLGALSPTNLATYETIFGGPARQQLESALAGRNPDLLARVVRRFYYTAAGFEAGNRLAAFWTDHGCDELAWSWWRRVLSEPAHHSRIHAMHCIKAAACGERLGRSLAASEVLGQVARDQLVTIAGREQSIAHWQAQLVEHTQLRATNAEALVVGERFDRNGSTTGSAPALDHQLWRQSLAGEKSRHIESLARAWEGVQVQSGLPLGTAQVPLLIGERLVFRDFEGLRAVDARTGERLWHYPCSSSLSRDIGPRQTAPSDGNPDPNNVMRYLVGNGILGTLASDGRQVFAVDQIEVDEAVSPGAAAPPGNAPASGQQNNVLAAFDVAAASGSIRPNWIAGGRAADAEPERSLEGHFFLGPPLPVEDRLFAVSECKQQLHLSCLKSEGGRLVWSQVICSVSQPIVTDHQRFALACSPTFSDGIVVCPTQAGVLVAVDGLSGMLLWAASHDDADLPQRQQISGAPHVVRRRHGHPGYVNLPIIHQSHVLYLPAHSEHIQCLDLATGRSQWRTERDDLESSTATEYVAAVTDHTVLVVGRRKCRGLSLATGAETWMVRLGSTPAGRGVRLGTSYHVPLDDGRIVSLDLDSGRYAAIPATSAATHLGNLAAGRDLIVSLGTWGVVAYPQAHNLLNSLETDLVQRGSAAAKLLAAAELELTLGQFDAAEEHFEKLLEQFQGTPPAARAAVLLRTLLAGRLPGGNLPPERSERRQFPGSRQPGEAILERLAALAASPDVRSRYVLERCRYGCGQNDPAAAFAAARQLAMMNVDLALAAEDDPSRTAASHVLAASLLKRLTPADQPIVERFGTQIGTDVARALAARDSAALQRLIRLCGDSRTADEVRLQLAQLLISQGSWQQAELVLLNCREGRVSETTGQATGLLAELWSRQGLHHEAARLLAELATQFGDIHVTPAQTGTAWLAALPRESPVFEAYRRLTPPVWSGADVRIVENRVSNDALQAAYNGNGVQNLATPRQSPFDLFDKGRGAAGVFSVVDRHSGLEYPETIQVPGRFFYPVSTQSGYLQHAHVGHFFPLGGTGTFYGISLLERKVLWTTTQLELAGLRDVVRVGPAGAGFCTFQFRQHLYVVDPLSGRVLWQRDDIEAAAGLMSEPYLGIIGDERALVVFASNGANYTVYDTGCGAELRRGRLDIQPRQQRRAIGRKLFHYSMAGNARRLRVWDALTDQFVWDEPAHQIAEASVLEGVPPGTKIVTFVRDTDEVAFVTTDGRIRVVDLVAGQTRVDVAVDPQVLDNLSFLRAFRDHERYYFNLQRTWPPGKAPSVPGNPISDAAIATVQVEGDLCAVDRRTQKMLWHRSLGKRSLLHLPDLPLPVLVSLCRIRTDDQSLLSVEVLDARTGETLSSRDGLFSDRLVQSTYDRLRGLIELRGGQTTIRLEFPTGVARLNAGTPSR